MNGDYYITPVCILSFYKLENVPIASGMGGGGYTYTCVSVLENAQERKCERSILGERRGLEEIAL